MEQKSIVLLSPHRSPVYVDIHEKPTIGNLLDEDYTECKSVFADEEYRFELRGIDVESISSIDFLINDEEQTIYYSDGVFSFSGDGPKRKYVFSNKFGFVEISIYLTYEDGSVETWYSEYLSVLVHKDERLESIEMMIDYVYNRQDQLLITGEVGTKTVGDVKPGKFINLDTRISLANEILKVYKDSYGYFSANSRFKTKVAYLVDDSNKLQNVSSKTLQYIATHPGYLKEGNLSGGVHIGNRNYIPQKTLIEKNVYSYDIYENRVIVGFVSKMINDINSMITDVTRLLYRRNSSHVENSEYVHSSYFIFQRTEKALMESLSRLNELKKEFEVIYNLYKRSLAVKEEKIVRMPKPSAIFLSVTQYNVLYKHIHRWFEFGIYNLDQERFMMSFINGSALYEVYVLAKLLEAIPAKGFSLQESYRYSYRVSGDSLYRNTICNNTFVFQREKERISLFYQPVIFSGTYKPVNGINLYRNNSLSFDGWGSYYYTPDYVIKYEDGYKEKYFILDAKYGDRVFVRKLQVAKLAFKYLFSISTRGNEPVDGLYVLYGESKKNDQYENVYDFQTPGKAIKPSFDLVPITAGVNNEKHMSNMSRIVDALLR
jgi:sulfur relay (sulfurtransferase) DsrC/TusE family protein